MCDISLQLTVLKNGQTKRADTPAVGKTQRQQRPEHIPSWEQEQTECIVSILRAVLRPHKAGGGDNSEKGHVTQGELGRSY